MLLEADKIIFTGPVGSGKTTAIAAISDKPPVRTDVGMSEQNEGASQETKTTTTVGMDYGFFKLDDGTSIHLYGTPGQERFDFMWKILVRGGIGLVVLIDNSRPSPVADLEFYLDSFKDFVAETGAVIGITRTDVSNNVTLEDYYNKLMERDQVLPLFEIDARSRDDVSMLVQSLMAYLSVPV